MEPFVGPCWRYPIATVRQCSTLGCSSSHCDWRTNSPILNCCPLLDTQCDQLGLAAIASSIFLSSACLIRISPVLSAETCCSAECAYKCFGSRKCSIRSQRFSVFSSGSFCSVGGKLETVRTQRFRLEGDGNSTDCRFERVPAQSPLYHLSCSSSTEADCCDQGWQQYKSKCFKYIQTKVNFKNGVQLCSHYNATLASVHSREELLFIEDIARRYSTASGVHWVRSADVPARI